MNNIYYISVNDVKENSTFSYSIEDKLIETSILDSQRIDIEPILGTNLYKKIGELIYDNSITGSTNSIYKELLDDYIFYTLIKSVQKRSLLTIYSKIVNAGVVTNDNENSTPVDIGILNKIRSEISNDFEYFSNKLKKFLCDSNIDEYINYNPDSLSYYDKPDKKDSYFSGLVL